MWTFNVYHGKVNVLVGENGAGKSTLMKILAGVERPSHGQVLAGRQKSTSAFAPGCHPSRDWDHLPGMNLCPNLSVVENIFLAREMHAARGDDR